MSRRANQPSVSVLIGAALVGCTARTPPDGSEAPIPAKLDVILGAADLEIAVLARDEVVYDLGCGDGRMGIAAAKESGARGVGVDLDPSDASAKPRRTRPEPASPIA